MHLLLLSFFTNFMTYIFLILHTLHTRSRIPIPLGDIPIPWVRTWCKKKMTRLDKMRGNYPILTQFLAKQKTYKQQEKYLRTTVWAIKKYWRKQLKKLPWCMINKMINKMREINKIWGRKELGERKLLWVSWVRKCCVILQFCVLRKKEPSMVEAREQAYGWSVL